MTILTNHAKFALAERAELLAAKIYEALAARFPDDPEAAAVFRRLREEELQHAFRVRMLLGKFMSQPAAFIDLGVDSEFLDAALATAEATLLDLERNGKTLTFEQACAVALELEHTLAVSSSAMMTAEADPGIKRFFASLVEQDKSHEDLLAGRVSRPGPPREAG